MAAADTPSPFGTLLPGAGARSAEEGEGSAGAAAGAAASELPLAVVVVVLSGFSDDDGNAGAVEESAFMPRSSIAAGGLRGLW